MIIVQLCPVLSQTQNDTRVDATVASHPSLPGLVLRVPACTLSLNRLETSTTLTLGSVLGPCDSVGRWVCCDPVAPFGPLPSESSINRTVGFCAPLGCCSHVPNRRRCRTYGNGTSLKLKKWANNHHMCLKFLLRYLSSSFVQLLIIRKATSGP